MNKLSKIVSQLACIIYFIPWTSNGQLINKDSLISIVKSGTVSQKVLAFEKIAPSLSALEADSVYNSLKGSVEHLEFRLDKYKLNLAIVPKIQHKDPIRAIKLVNEAYEISNSIDSVKLMIKAKKNLFTIYQLITGDEAKALNELIDMDNLYKQRGVKDERIKAMIMVNFGVYFFASLGEYDKAEKYFKETVRTYLQSGREKDAAIIYFNIGSCMTKANNLDSSLIYFDSALTIQKKYKQAYYEAYIHGSKSEVYLKKKQYTIALKELDSSYHLSLLPEDKISTHVWLRRKGHVYTAMGDLLNARKCYENAISLINSINKTNYITMADNLTPLAKIYDSLGLFNLGSRAKTSLMIAQDSIASHTKRQTQQELLVKFKVKEYESALTQQKQIENNYQTIILLLIALISSIILITIIILIKRKQIVNIRHRTIELDKRNLETQLEIKTLYENKLRKELDLQNQELTAQANNIAEKSGLLEQIQQEINNIKQGAPLDTRNQLNALASKFNTSQRLDKDWENFKIYFEQVHKGFFDNLCVTYPDLSPKEIRLCALLKLNMDTKQIATILEISTDSAKMARHRIRKKLGLNGEENLVNFFNRFNVKQS